MASIDITGSSHFVDSRFTHPGRPSRPFYAPSSVSRLVFDTDIENSEARQRYLNEPFTPIEINRLVRGLEAAQERRLALISDYDDVHDTPWVHDRDPELDEIYLSPRDYIPAEVLHNLCLYSRGIWISVFPHYWIDRRIEQVNLEERRALLASSPVHYPQIRKRLREPSTDSDDSSTDSDDSTYSWA